MPDGALTALIAGEVQPEQIAQSADQYLAGQVRGRLLVHFASQPLPRQHFARRSGAPDRI